MQIENMLSKTISNSHVNAFFEFYPKLAESMQHVRETAKQLKEKQDKENIKK